MCKKYLAFLIIVYVFSMLSSKLFFSERRESINLNASIKADLIYEPTTGISPATVQFFCVANAPASTRYLWDFGDGSRSEEQFPTHSFTESGVYDVKLSLVFSGGYNETIARINILDGTEANIGIDGGSISSTLGASITIAPGVLSESVIFKIADTPETVIREELDASIPYDGSVTINIAEVTESCVPCQGAGRKFLVPATG